MKSNHSLPRLHTRHPFRNTRLSYHHLTARFKGGTDEPSNVIRIWADRHEALHQVFGLASLESIIDNFYLYRFYNKRPQWRLIFGYKSDFACLHLLRRLLKIKNNLKQRQWEH